MKDGDCVGKSSSLEAIMVVDIYVPLSLAWSVNQDDEERHSLVSSPPQ